MLLPRTFSLHCTNTLIAGCRHSFQIQAVKCKRNGNILFGSTFLCLVGREHLIYSQVMLQLVRCNSKKWHNDMIATQRLYCAIPGNIAHNTISSGADKGTSRNFTLPVEGPKCFLKAFSLRIYQDTMLSGSIT